MGKVIFVTYASSVYKKNIFWNKLFVRLFIRPDKILFYTDVDLKASNIYKENRDVFDAARGGGYWAWKPWVILKAIESADEGDVVIYQDCGKGLKYKNFRKPVNVIAYALNNDAMPGVLVPIHGKSNNWTHHKCFELMGCCEEKYYNTPMVEASISAWSVNARSRGFIEEWLSYCLNAEVVGDLPVDKSRLNDGFLNHRYDQSVLTNLVIKRDLHPVRLSFDDMHLSKSISLVDLDLGNRSLSLWVVLKLNRFLLLVKKILPIQ